MSQNYTNIEINKGCNFSNSIENSMLFILYTEFTQYWKLILYSEKLGSTLKDFSDRCNSIFYSLFI